MRLLPVVLVSVSLLLSSAGQAAERKFSIFGFDDIRIGNGVDVVLTSGKGPSARAEGSNREILDRVSLQKNGKQLVVSVRPKSLDRNNYEEDAPVTLYLSSFAIENLTHLGSGMVTLDTLSGRTPKVRLDVVMAGGGQLTMAGEAVAARLELQGASIFESPNLEVEKLILIQRGPVSSHLAVEREANITNFGTGRIQIEGRPNCMVRTDGSAEIICNPDR